MSVQLTSTGKELIMLILVLGLLLAAPATDAELVELVLRPTPESLAAAVRELSAAEFADRERASRYLWCCGARAKEVLTAAAKGDDQEARGRAAVILKQIATRKLPEIEHDRLRGIVQCRLGHWREGLLTLWENKALGDAELVFKELPAGEATAGDDARESRARRIFEERDWPALFKVAEHSVGSNLHGTTLRLALLPALGREQEAPELLREMRSLVDANSVLAYEAAGGLILARRGADALKLVRERRRMMAFQLLVSELRYREAFAALDIPLPSADPERWLDKLWSDQPESAKKDYLNKVSHRADEVAFVAHTVATLGEHDIAARLMTKAGDLAETDEWYGWALRGIWQDELKLGQNDRAWRHLGTAAENMLRHEERGPETRNQALCWRHPEAAGAWWDYFQTVQKQPAHEAARNVVCLLDPQTSKELSPDEVRDWIVQLELHAGAFAGEDEIRHLRAAACAADAHQLGEFSLPLWSRIEELQPTLESAMAIADRHAEARKWDDAAKWYGLAWSRDSQKKLLPLVLQARALTEARQIAETQQVRLLVQLWPLANREAPLHAAYFLKQRGLLKEAGEQYAAARAYVRAEDLSNIYLQLAEEQAESNPREAAALFDRVRMQVLLSTSILTSDELSGPFSGEQELAHRIDQLEALGLIREGKYDRALTAALAAESACPALFRYVVQLVRAFDEAGAKAEADALFEKLWSRRRTIIDDFPKAAEYHEQLAAIGAGCQRHPAESLTHAKRAVELRPRHVPALLTLARVHRAGGNHDLAQVSVKAALMIDPASKEGLELQRSLSGKPPRSNDARSRRPEAHAFHRLHRSAFDGFSGAGAGAAEVSSREP